MSFADDLARSDRPGRRRLVLERAWSKARGQIVGHNGGGEPNEDDMEELLALTALDALCDIADRQVAL